ncbi:DICT sensory domain-containing protein [Anabaena sp. CA = ATCC 33047]|uniref:DICT sensory domain-containing protein n=1 Tax=Anabaena sp. (strain CA / ATCC 33047) TaxID=52271 RepID=UPI00082C6CDB|nr:DICT sensory domain-containing protein [Anabaena sp. CA = ATCC 33047]
MNDFLHQDLSVYQLAVGAEASPQPIPLNAATLLSMVRAQIDLLIEQQINATLWVKLPPGKIWCQELRRYQLSIKQPINIYNCQIKGADAAKKDIVTQEEQQETMTPYINQVDVELLANNQLHREYFLVVLSPKFSSLLVASQQVRNDESENLAKENSPKNLTLLTITTIDSRVIQNVLDGLKQEIQLESNQIAPADLICQNICEPALWSLLFAKQIQRQDEINRQIRHERIGKLQGQNQTLQKKEQQKDEYLKNVSQELRTPLTQMKTALSLLSSPNLKPQQRQRYLQMLNTQCDRQSTLITSLLDLVELEHTLEATNLELVKLADIVPGVVSTYQPVAQEKGIMLAYTIPTDLPPVWCVNGGLRQIVIHLLYNSLKFTPTGGEVWVTARIEDEYVQLEVRDTGIGIAEGEIPKIFDCFYRVRSGNSEEINGAGLGLTIVQRLLWNCGGSITVKSQLDEGSIFTVQLVPEGKDPKLGGR